MTKLTNCSIMAPRELPNHRRRGGGGFRGSCTTAAHQLPHTPTYLHQPAEINSSRVQPGADPLKFPAHRHGSAPTAAAARGTAEPDSPDPARSPASRSSKCSPQAARPGKRRREAGFSGAPATGTGSEWGRLAAAGDRSWERWAAWEM